MTKKNKAWKEVGEIVGASGESMSYVSRETSANLEFNV